MQHDMDSEDSESCAGAVGGGMRGGGGGDDDEEEEDFGYDDDYMFDPALDDDMFGEDIDLSKRLGREEGMQREGGVCVRKEGGRHATCDWLFSLF